MSDLISRSELIKELNKYCGSQRYLVSENIREIINNQPTAYDIDKVVEELQAIKGYACLGRQCTPHCEYYKECYKGEKAEKVAIDKAIEIVKQLGVSDDVCEWKHDSHLENDTPAEWLICPHSPKKIFSMGIKYCPYCGKRIKVVE